MRKAEAQEPMARANERVAAADVNPALVELTPAENSVGVEGIEPRDDS
jgi:hypothetical protein